VCAKSFMQEIWLQDLGWDDKLPIELCMLDKKKLKCNGLVNRLTQKKFAT